MTIGETTISGQPAVTQNPCSVGFNCLIRLSLFPDRPDSFPCYSSQGICGASHCPGEKNQGRTPPPHGIPRSISLLIPCKPRAHEVKGCESGCDPLGRGRTGTRVRNRQKPAYLFRVKSPVNVERSPVNRLKITCYRA